MTDSTTTELLALSQELLEAIAAGDWDNYARLCDPSLSCFEPEARGHLVEGLEFHRYYFELEQSASPRRNTISSPHVRLLGDTAVVSYIRLVQKLDASGGPVTVATEETRVWQKRPQGWRHVHFHRSAC
jgi:calcium/calmodulin-dependent protein kinase (CaM kinase) II